MESAVERRQTPASTPGIRVILPPRDPPDQRSYYITPGDPRQETYRLSTFVRFPDHNVDSWSLARSGFYFTGYKDRIKCFRCGVAVENLSRDNGQHFSEWHSQECEFANGGQAGNVPIGQRRSASPNSPITGLEEENPTIHIGLQFLDPSRPTLYNTSGNGHNAAPPERPSFHGLEATSSSASASSRFTAASFFGEAAAAYWNRLHEWRRHCPYLLFCELYENDRQDLWRFPVFNPENASSIGQHVAPTGDIIEESEEF